MTAITPRTTRTHASLLAGALTLIMLTACQQAPPQVSPAASKTSESTPTHTVTAFADLFAGRTPLADPRTARGETHASLAADTIRTLPAPVTPVLPVTVDSVGSSGPHTVTVTDTSRILALDMAGSLAATVWALGAGPQLVGRDTTSTFPGIADLPSVMENGHSLSVERVLELAPTIILTDGSLDTGGPFDALRDAGIPVVVLESTPSPEGARALALATAKTLGIPAAGKDLAERYDAELADIKAALASAIPADSATRPRILFLFVRGTANLYSMYGSGTGADELIRMVGGVDVATEIGLPGRTPMTDEAVLAANPDIILTTTTGLASVGGAPGLLQAKPALANTAAGKATRFIDLPDSAVFAFGPRTADVVAALALAVYTP